MVPPGVVQCLWKTGTGSKGSANDRREHGKGQGLGGELSQCCQFQSLAADAETQWLPTPVERPSDWKTVATLATAAGAAGIGGMAALDFCPTKLIYTERPWPRLTSQANYPGTVKAQLWAAGYTLPTLPGLEKWTMNVFALLNSTNLDMRILCFKESRQIQIQDLTFPASFPTLHMTGHHELTALGMFLLFSSFHSVSGISETHPGHHISKH